MLSPGTGDRQDPKKPGVQHSGRRWPADHNFLGSTVRVGTGGKATTADAGGGQDSRPGLSATSNQQYRAPSTSKPTGQERHMQIRVLTFMAEDTNEQFSLVRSKNIEHREPM